MESRNSASHSRTAGCVSEPGIVREIATSTSVRSGVMSAGQRSSWTVPTGGSCFVAQRAPPIACQLAEARRRGPVDHGLHLVIRAVRLAAGDPRGFLDPMRARVPSVAGQIDAAAERELIVNDHDLLMVAAADRMAVVEAESHAARHSPAESPSRERIALERVEGPVVPDQDVAAKTWTPSRDEGQQLVEASRRLRRTARPDEIDGARRGPSPE